MTARFFNTLSAAGSILLLGVASASVSYAGPVCDACNDPAQTPCNIVVPPDVTLNAGDCAGATVICVTGDDQPNTIDTSAVTLPTCVEAGAGDDIITTGDATDEIIAGRGEDTIDAGEGGGDAWGWQISSGGGEDDDITAGDGNDRILGAAGNDTIDAGDGTNLVSGGSGDDRIVAGAGDDDIRGQGGCDYIDAGPAPGEDEIKGGGATRRCSNPITGNAEDVLCTEQGTIKGQGGTNRCYTDNGGAKNCDTLAAYANCP